jgi:transcriptional regulator with XRE-family HTH domain
MAGFNEKIKKIREILGISQAKLAELINTHSITISRYERGEGEPSIDVLIKLVNNLSVNPNWLLTGEGNPFKNEEVINIVKDQTVASIMKLLNNMNDDQKKEILKHIEREKLLADLIEERKHNSADC